MSYKLTITQEKDGYKVVVNGKGVVRIKELKELETAIKSLTVGVSDCD